MGLALTGGTVLTSLDPPSVTAGDVLIDGGRVAAVGTAPPGGERFDVSGCLVLPGNVCAHTHLYSALSRGMPYALEPPANFLQILQRVWWRLDRALDEELVRASALAGGMEALLSGTTTLVDHHASPNAIDGSLDVIADALESLGMRSVLCYEVTDRDGPERSAAGIEENRRFLRAAPGRALTRGMVGAHASFTLSDETLAGCVGAARDARTGIHIHVAEDEADERDAGARFGVRTVERLADAGALSEDALFAHCVRVDDREISLVRAAGATVAHNPRSNMNNSVGRAPVAKLPRVALGTDGIGGDLFAESKAAYWRAREDDVFTPIAVPLTWLAEGARFAGKMFGESALGRIEPGAPADLVVLDYAPPTPLTGDNVAGHWIFGFGERHVRDVVVDGEVVVRDRRLTKLDQDKLVAETAEAAGRLWERMQTIGPHEFEPKG